MAVREVITNTAALIFFDFIATRGTVSEKKERKEEGEGENAFCIFISPL